MKESSARKASDVESREAKRKQQLAVKEQKAKKRKARKESKAKKDPNKPKRAPTAFFVFMEDFRKTYKEENPNVKGVAAVGKACGDKWKEMSEEEKAPYIQKAAQKKVEYEKALASYNKKQTAGASNRDADEEEADEEEEAEGSEEEDDDE